MNQKRRSIKQIVYYPWMCLCTLQQVIMSITLILILVGMITEVVLRYVFSFPLLGIEEIICLVAFWLYFMGASYAAYEGTHIKSGILMSLPFMANVKARKRAWIDAGISLLTVVLSANLVRLGWLYFQWGLTKGEVSSAYHIPMVLSQASIFFSGILMSLYFGIELAGHVQRALTGKPQSLKDQIESK